MNRVMLQSFAAVICCIEGTIVKVGSFFCDTDKKRLGALHEKDIRKGGWQEKGRGAEKHWADGKRQELKEENTVPIHREERKKKALAAASAEEQEAVSDRMDRAWLTDGCAATVEDDSRCEK